MNRADAATPPGVADSPSAVTENLRRLYFVRFVFAVAWAGTFLGVGHSIDAASVTLLILYPLVDVLAAVVDFRSSRNPVLWINMAVSTLAAIGFAAAASSGIPAVLRVWGVWAIVAGLVQLIVAVRRRTMAGQWPMMLAGGISLLAGAAFLVGAGASTSMSRTAGYAALGGLFFLASALRLDRNGRGERPKES